LDKPVFLGSITTADGSAMVKIGNTTVICGIKAVRIICIFHKAIIWWWIIKLQHFVLTGINYATL